MSHSRREFLRRSTCAALGAAAVSAGFESFGLVSAYAQITPNAPTDYKALVCILLNGGNDGNNLVVPLATTQYNQYATVRNASGLALGQAQLLPITPSSLGTQYGLHPNLTELHGLWGSGRLAIAPNVGPLVFPITRAEYRAGSVKRPYQLFSHSDQVTQALTSRSDTRTQTGWGGLLADNVIVLNNGSLFPVVTSIAGTTLFGQGVNTRQIAVAAAPTALNQLLTLNGFTGAGADVTVRRTSMDFLRTVDRSATLVRAYDDAMQQAVDVSLAFSTDQTLTTVFPATSIGNQLHQVAKLIKLNYNSAQLGINRQIFFCSLGGFDTHQNQVATQATLLGQLSAAMKAFYDASVELGLSNRVTTFTLSDFGRTLQPAGTGTSAGTDHGWGNHLFVMGDAVRGGDFYGVAGPNGTVFPTLQLSGPDDTDSRGRWIPTASVDQYAATLAKWFGVSASDIPSIFPLIGRFTTPDLGFMS